MSELDTESLSARALKGSFWASTSNWLLKITTAITLFVTLNYLSVYEYGVVQVVLSFFTFGVLFNLSAFHDLFVTEMGIYRKTSLPRSKGLFWGYLKAQALFSFILWAIFFFGAPLVSSIGKASTEVIPFIRIISFLFLLSPIREAVQLLLNVELRFFEIAYFGVLEQISRLVILVIALVWFDAGIAGVLLATVLSQVFALVTIGPKFVRIYQPLKETNRENASILSILLAHGKWGLFVSYISNFNKTLRIWLIQLLAGAEAVGLYGVASNLFSHTRSVLPISEVVTPIIPQYVADRPRLAMIVNKSIKYSLISYVALGIVGFIVFPPLISWLFPSYAPGMLVYKIMLVALIPHSLTIIFTPLFYAFRSQRELFFAYMRRIVLTLIFLPVCYKLFGLTGLAIEFVLTAFIFMLDRYMMAKRLLPELSVSLKNMFTIDEYDRVITGRLRGYMRKII